MPNINDLVPTLASMPRHEYSELIRQVDEQRRQAVERLAHDCHPRNGMSRDDFAVWVARQHFAIDKGITRVLYLPTGAPAEEVRLLEVNALASLPENAPVTAVDFMPDVEGVNFTLYVADVTPRQIEAILSRKVPLPEGWHLEGFREITEPRP